VLKWNAMSRKVVYLAILTMVLENEIFPSVVVVQENYVRRGAGAQCFI
jgi:hypothetical protein